MHSFSWGINNTLNGPCYCPAQPWIQVALSIQVARGLALGPVSPMYVRVLKNIQECGILFPKSISFFPEFLDMCSFWKKGYGESVNLRSSDEDFLLSNAKNPPL